MDIWEELPPLEVIRFRCFRWCFYWPVKNEFSALRVCVLLPCYWVLGRIGSGFSSLAGCIVIKRADPYAFLLLFVLDLEAVYANLDLSSLEVDWMGCFDTG